MIGVILVIILIIGVFASMSRTVPPPTPPRTVPTWHPIASYSGSDPNNGNSRTNTTTDIFTVRGSQFRLDWSYDSHFPEAALLEVEVFYPGKLFLTGCATGVEFSDIYPGCMVGSQGSFYSGNLTATGPRSFQLNVQTTVIVTWSVTVEELLLVTYH